VGRMDGDEMGYYQRLGRALRDVRVYYRRSQPDIAKLTGHAVSTISNWETGKAQPSPYDLHLIAREFGVPAEVLLDPPEAAVSPVWLALRDQDAPEPPARPTPRVVGLRGPGRRPPRA